MSTLTSQTPSTCQNVPGSPSGDLLGFLRASRGHYGMYTVNPGIRNHQPPNLQLSSRDLLSIGAKVANGMRFLADRKVCIYSLTNMYSAFLTRVQRSYVTLRVEEGAWERG